MKPHNKLITLAVVFLLVGCATPRYAYHVKNELKDCQNPVQKRDIIKALVHDGYLHSTEINPNEGVVEKREQGQTALDQQTLKVGDYFHRPKILKKGLLAQEPYEDADGNFVLSVCNSQYVMTEESKSCVNKKDCTAQQQLDVKKILEKFGCSVNQVGFHSLSWNLHERQDWSSESCAQIVQELSGGQGVKQ